jgi:hypothetical protein
MVVDPDPYPHSECEMRIHKRCQKNVDLNVPNFLNLDVQSYKN